MKEFFTQCLKDLEEISGIRQLFWLQSDLEDGERRKNVLINGMVAAAATFTYITDQEKQRIIRRMMVEDQTYEALNSRVINKWLSGAKDAHVLRAHSEPDPAPAYTEYLKICEENGMAPLPEDQYDKPLTHERMATVVTHLQTSLAKIGRVTSPQPFEEKGLPKSVLPEYLVEHTFVIEGIEIVADNEENARTIYHLRHAPKAEPTKAKRVKKPKQQSDEIQS